MGACLYSQRVRRDYLPRMSKPLRQADFQVSLSWLRLTHSASNLFRVSLLGPLIEPVFGVRLNTLHHQVPETCLSRVDSRVCCEIEVSWLGG